MSAGIRWRRRHVETQRNPTDRGSRLACVGDLPPGSIVRRTPQQRRAAFRAAERASARACGLSHADFAAALSVPVPKQVRSGPRGFLEPIEEARGASGAVNLSVSAASFVPAADLPEDQSNAYLDPSYQRFLDTPESRQPSLCVTGEPQSYSSWTTPSTTTTCQQPTSSPALPRRVRRAQRRCHRDAWGRGREPRAFLELFGGCARLTAAAGERGLHWLPAFELLDGEVYDLTDSRVVDAVCALLRSNKVWAVHLAPPCASWGTAIKRMGHTGNADLGMACARSTVRILDVIRETRVLFSLENPLPSGLWRWAPLQKALACFDQTTLQKI